MTDYLFEYVNLAADPRGRTNILISQHVILPRLCIIPHLACLVSGLVLSVTSFDAVAYHWHSCE